MKVKNGQTKSHLYLKTLNNQNTVAAILYFNLGL